MTSLIALYRRRGTVLLITMGLSLTALLVALVLGFDSGLTGHVLEESDAALMASLREPLSQGLAVLFWFTLSMILGIIWSRALLRSTDLSEIYLVGALMGAAGFPILYGVLSLFFYGLSQLEDMPVFLMEGNIQSYALTGLFLLLLFGVLVLIGREALNAARKPV